MEESEKCPSCGLAINISYNYCPSCAYALIEHRLNRKTDQEAADDKNFGQVKGRIMGLEERSVTLQHRLDSFMLVSKILIK